MVSSNVQLQTVSVLDLISSVCLYDLCRRFVVGNEIEKLIRAS